ncbi:hypothetical protein OPKNFCMD_2198 [Methylobacterium crusticola]|uniref:Uncharacterized protein n=1 Tax=Methylobacterium crusticola TaxID=1697972 RepID=A0ABQ4QVT0_9HYPH|nr:hypothetical protein OPKNFCMD_2198 [Methylobacterium crusticola]
MPAPLSDPCCRGAPRIPCHRPRLQPGAAIPCTTDATRGLVRAKQSEPGRVSAERGRVRRAAARPGSGDGSPSSKTGPKSPRARSATPPDRLRHPDSRVAPVCSPGDDVRRIDAARHRRHGAPRVHAAQRADGRATRRGRLERPRRLRGISTLAGRRFRPCTTTSRDDLPSRGPARACLRHCRCDVGGLSPAVPARTLRDLVAPDPRRRKVAVAHARRRHPGPASRTRGRDVGVHAGQAPDRGSGLGGRGGRPDGGTKKRSLQTREKSIINFIHEKTSPEYSA